MPAPRSAGVLRVALCCALILAALALVIRRQSKALEVVRAVEKTRTERTLVEAQRAELLHRIEWLQSRGHVAEAAARHGMRLPSGAEIVIRPESVVIARGEGTSSPAVALQ